MNADQVIEGIGKAVAASNPAQEYCALWIDSWATCMTKSEWSSWVQAIGSILAICAAFVVLRLQNISDYTRHRATAASICSSFIGSLNTVGTLLPADGSRSIWTVTRVKILIESELKRAEALEMHVLCLAEQKGVFNYRMAAMQIIEALRIAENQVDTTENSAVVRGDVYVFLQGVISDAQKTMEVGRNHLGSWVKD